MEPPPPAVPTQLSMVTQPSATARNAAALPTQPAVRLRDSQGRPVALAGVVVTAGLSSGTATLAGTSATTDASGVATFSGLTITGLVGSYTLHFSAGSLTPVDAQALTLAAGTPTQMALVTQPSTSAQAGVALAQQPVAQLRDVSGNDATQAGVLVTAALVAGSVTVTNASAATDATGKATFSGLTLSGTAGSYTLRFSAPNLPSVDAAAATALAGGSPTQLVLTTQPSGTAVNGTALATQPVVQLRDAFGNDSHHSGDTVTASVISGTGTLSNATATTDSLGRATFSGLTITGTAGSISLRFSASSLTSAVASVVLTAGSATKLGLATAPPASAQSGVALSPAPVVQVQDAQGNAVRQAGVTVTAELASGSVSLSGTSATTDTTGKATFTGLTAAGVAGGTFTLRFTAPSLSAVTGNSTLLTAGPANRLAITTQPASTAQNAVALSQQPAVQLKDNVGNTVSQSGVIVTATLVSGSATLSGATATTNTSGTATFSGLTITGTVGSYTLRFGAPNVASVDAAAPTQLSAGAATQLTLTTQPSTSAQSGVALATQPAVQLRDVSGNAVSQAAVTVTAGVVSGTATLANATMATNASGLATFSGLAISALAGSYTLRFSAPSLTAADAGAPTLVSAGTVAQVAVITEPPSSAQNGIPLTPQPVIEVRDAAGNLVAGASVVATIAGGPVGGGLAGATATSDGSGRATFTGLTISGTAGSYTLSFSSGSGTVTAAVTTDLEAGRASSLTVLVEPPTSAQSGIALATAPVVEVRDTSSNLVSGVVVTATVVSGAVTLANATALSNGSGQASFGGLTITGPVGDYTLRFTVGPVGVNARAATTLAAGSPAQLAVTTPPPTSAQSGVALSPAPVVTVRDGAGNGVPSAVVTASVVSGTVTITNGTATANGSGVATFSGLTLTGASGSYTLRFTSGSAAVNASAATTLSAGAPASVSIVTPPPTSAQSGVTFSTIPVVEVRDASSNLVIGVAVTAGVVSGSVTFSNGTATTGSNGRATFTGIAISGTVNNYTLTFTAGAASATASGTTSLTAGPVSQLTLTTPPSATAQSGVPLATQPVVLVRDATGNAVPSVTVSATTTGNVTWTGGTTLTNASGVATFTSLTLTGAVAGYSLKFGAGEPQIQIVASTPTALSAGPAASLALTTEPATAAQSGIALTTQPALLVKDGANNPIAGVVVTASIAGGGGPALANATATTNDSGVATFSGLTMTGSTGSFTLRFSGASLTADAAQPTVLSAGTPAGRSFQTTPSSTANNGVALATQPVVLVQDGAGNGVPGVVVGAAVTSVGVTVTNGSKTTDASGLATFSNLALSGSAGSYTLHFSAASLTPLDHAITLNPGEAAKDSITTQPPTNAQNGVAFATAPVVHVRDVSGNPVSGVTIVATATGASLTNATAVTNQFGDATFTGLTMTGPAGDYTLVFSVGPLTATANVTHLTVGGGTKLALSGQPGTAAQSGVVLAQQPVVQITDAGGNATTTGGVLVTASLVSGSLTLSNATATTNGSGTASFSGLTLTGAVGSYTLRFTTTAGYTSVDATSPTVLSAGPAAQLTVTTDPSDATILGSPLSQQPAVQLRDASGNPVLSSGVTVTASVVTGSPTLAGASDTTDTNGTAAFDSLRVTSPVGTYRFRFSSPPASAATAGDSTIAAQRLTSGVPITVSSSVNEQKFFGITVPNGATQLAVTITGGSSQGDDADLFVRFAHAPDRAAQIWDCGNSPGYAGSSETCILPNPQQGDWYVLVFAFFSYSNVTLTATVSP